MSHFREEIQSLRFFLCAMRWKGMAEESGKGLEQLQSMTQCQGPGLQGAKQSQPTYSPQCHQSSGRGRRQPFSPPNSIHTPKRRLESGRVCLARSQCLCLSKKAPAASPDALASESALQNLRKAEELDRKATMQFITWVMLAPLSFCMG